MGSPNDVNNAVSLISVVGNYTYGVSTDSNGVRVSEASIFVLIDDKGNYGKGINIVNENIRFMVEYVNIAPSISAPVAGALVVKGSMVLEYGGEYISILDSSDGDITVLFNCYHCVLVFPPPPGPLSGEGTSSGPLSGVGGGACAQSSMNMTQGGLYQHCITGPLQYINTALAQVHHM